MLQIPNALAESPLTFPVLEVFHILGFALSIGTVAIVDLRLLGLGMRHQTPAEITQDVAPYTLVGLGCMLLSGSLLFSSDPDMYYLNPAFQLKMVLLAAGILFHYTIHSKTVSGPASPAKSKLVACVSLFLWVGVVAGGIFTAFVE